MATLLEELSQIVAALAENEIEYAVCGGRLWQFTLSRGFDKNEKTGGQTAGFGRHREVGK
jgi:hypothetical protein